MSKQTSGDATILGKSIRTDMPEIRKNIGVCLQHDCLYPLLTVEEHIQFFSQIKGLYDGKMNDKTLAEKSVSDSIDDVGLTEKRNTYSKNLSGGMKRKLSVAIAFCGGSSVVFLDEPTSGMDPYSRRFTWNVIREYRPDRCIILTTHFMDEADLLGDRIAIMARGNLRCVGYSPRGSTTLATEEEEEEESIEQKLTDIVQNSVRESKLLSDVGTSMSFQLPLENNNTMFMNIFEQLDELVEESKIVTYGVNMTSLDEVFLMVTRDTSDRSSSKTVESNNPDPLFRENEVFTEGDVQAVSPTIPENLANSGTFWRHMHALLLKRVLNFKRDKKLWIISILLPAIFSVVGFSIMEFSGLDNNMPSLSLSLDDFNPKLEGMSRRNPIVYNSADLFQCHTGRCINEVEYQEIPETGESYFMCGGSGYSQVSTYAMCSSSPPWENIVSEITQAGAFPVEDTYSINIGQASRNMRDFAAKFEATMYGALFFTRGANSTIVDLERDRNQGMGHRTDGGSRYIPSTGPNNTVLMNVSYKTSKYGSTESDGSLYNVSVIEACQKNPGNYTTQEQCLQYNGVNYIVSTNFTSYHATVVYQALADEAIINAVLEDDVSISVTIHPLPFTEPEKEYLQAEKGIIGWFLMMFCFPFIAASFGVFVVTERQSKAKHLQTIAGVKPTAYWLSTFLWDLINYQIPLCIILFFMYTINVEIFTTTDRGARYGTLSLLILFGPASAGFSYVLSYLFRSPSKANFTFISSNLLIGIVGPFIVLTLRMIVLSGDLTYYFFGIQPDSLLFLVKIAATIEWILRVSPCFCLGKGLFFLVYIPVFETFGPFGYKNISVWDPDILYYEVLFLAVESVVYPLFALILDYSTTNMRVQKLWNIFSQSLKFRCCRRTKVTEEESVTTRDVDEDVAAEIERVTSGDTDSDLILMDNLSKKYPNGLLAVDKLCLGIPAGECFGLLGINGAGKTTTMGILTAEFPPTYGDALLSGYSVTGNPEKIRSLIGYCPQFDSHFSNMTGREHVELYASIKGLPKNILDRAVSKTLDHVGLSSIDSKKLSSNYSGGMKRKLSVACALIGQPPIIFLDEPSTGMDPLSRRELWDVISTTVAETRTSMILTTHSMEECEALCPRIAIMAGGKLRCLGSAQRLKSRFGKGFQLELKVSGVKIEDEDYRDVSRKLIDFIRGEIDQDESSVGAIEDAEDGESIHRVEETTMIHLDLAKSAVESVTGDASISDSISPTDQIGLSYVIYKNATSEAGVSVKSLSIFCTEELRMKRVTDSILASYPQSILRERQDNKVRYQIVGEELLKVSSLFMFVENKKEELKLTDYGISQTSLEQVFNMHIAG
eukprot:CAMPEP_0178972746 /NCGR_PEP_ID=MMETSP0789-20121207/21232_1 /TAXON_ID=3005 /ORGANISM="Rhizosolenia setigera, Strain CCMP 1694" /LENGTH=1341 /DNA_ID=CAMNT_0020660323 /DNA_START=1119 /DNA_END=5142 /DNA_ORIENTATION=+